MTITIKFLMSGTDDELGSIEKTGLKKALIPKWSDRHPVYIIRHFDSYARASYWRVVSVDHTTEEVAIPEEPSEVVEDTGPPGFSDATVATDTTGGSTDVEDTTEGSSDDKGTIEGSTDDDPEPETKTVTTVYVRLAPETGSPMSYGQYSKQASKRSLAFHLKEYQVVDVDFGHHSSVLTHTSVDDDNSEYLSTLLEAELHKRRPCIVLSKEGNTVQVLPLSTNRHKDEFAINPDIFSGLASRYNGKTSYALPQLIQTVSPLRVFPLLMGDYKAATLSNRRMLGADDRKFIDDLLINHVSPTISRTVTQQEARLKTLGQERSAQLVSNTELNREIGKLKGVILRFGGDLVHSDSSSAVATPEEVIQAVYDTYPEPEN